MFKITRYFFVLFVLTTVLPLFALFFFFHIQMLSIEKQNASHIISIGVKEAKDYFEETQKIQETEIINKLQNIKGTILDKKTLAKYFPDTEINFIYNEQDSTIDYYFKNIKNKIYIVNNIPIKNSQVKAIEFTTPADFSNARIRGPFTAELYIGSKISKENLIYVFNEFNGPREHNMFGQPMPPPEMNDRRMPPPGEMGPPPFQKNGMQHDMANFGPPPHMQNNTIPKSDAHIGIPKNRHINYSIMNLQDKNGKTVATVLIKVSERMPGPPPFIKNTLSLIILLAGILLSVGGADFINKNYVIPLITLSDATKEVQSGNLDIKITANSNQDQIIKTFDYFNDMVEGLKEKEELRKSFIASLTHDLRTPIVAQERSLGLIAETFKNLKMQDEYELSKTLEKNNKHLLRIVNLILESYKFEKEEIKLSYAEININEVIEDCFEKIKTIAEEKNIALINNTDKNFKHLKADKISMERILINLISNSIENIEENKFVKVSAKELENKNIQITVEDNGPGIAASEINYIFNAYYTGKGIDRKIGSGLGLDVCKKLVEMHKGTITVNSEVNKYTKFTITLPS